MIKVIKEVQLTKLYIEYDLQDDNEPWDYLDGKYGKFNYRILRTGPKKLDATRASADIGLAVIEV